MTRGEQYTCRNVIHTSKYIYLFVLTVFALYDRSRRIGALLSTILLCERIVTWYATAHSVRLVIFDSRCRSVDTPHNMIYSL